MACPGLLRPTYLTAQAPTRLFEQRVADLQAPCDCWLNCVHSWYIQASVALCSRSRTKTWTSSQPYILKQSRHITKTSPPCPRGLHLRCRGPYLHHLPLHGPPPLTPPCRPRLPLPSLPLCLQPPSSLSHSSLPYQQKTGLRHQCRRLLTQNHQQAKQLHMQSRLMWKQLVMQACRRICQMQLRRLTRDASATLWPAQAQGHPHQMRRGLMSRLASRMAWDISAWTRLSAAAAVGDAADPLSTIHCWQVDGSRPRAASPSGVLLSRLTGLTSRPALDLTRSGFLHQPLLITHLSTCSSLLITHPSLYSSLLLTHASLHALPSCLFPERLKDLHVFRHDAIAAPSMVMVLGNSQSFATRNTLSHPCIYPAPLYILQPDCCQACGLDLPGRHSIAQSGIVDSFSALMRCLGGPLSAAASADFIILTLLHRPCLCKLRAGGVISLHVLDGK